MVGLLLSQADLESETSKSTLQTIRRRRTGRSACSFVTVISQGNPASGPNSRFPTRVFVKGRKKADRA